MSQDDYHSESNTSNKKYNKGVISSIKEFFGFGRVNSLLDSVNELIKEHSDDSSLQKDEREMLENIVTFHDVKVSEIMVPRTDIIGIYYQSSYKEVCDLIIRDGHTRFPIYKESLDEIIGFLHVKDTVPYAEKPKSFSIEKIAREILYVPKSMKLQHLLAKMRQSATHMAIVLDEYGGTEGLVTIEDVFEELIGEIQDEHDTHETKEQHIIKKDDQTFIIDGRTKIEDIEKVLGISLSKEEGEYETLGGFLMSYLGYVPQIGEKRYYDDSLAIEVLDSDIRRIKKVMITKT